jgi:hypothetical protein
MFTIQDVFFTKSIPKEIQADLVRAVKDFVAEAMGIGVQDVEKLNDSKLGVAGKVIADRLSSLLSFTGTQFDSEKIGGMTLHGLIKHVEDVFLQFCYRRSFMTNFPNPNKTVRINVRQKDKGEISMRLGAPLVEPVCSLIAQTILMKNPRKDDFTIIPSTAEAYKLYKSAEWNSQERILTVELA